MKLVIKAETRDVRHYAALEMILTGSEDMWESDGHNAVNCLGYWLDCIQDKMINSEDGPEFDEMITRVAKRRGLVIDV